MTTTCMTSSTSSTSIVDLFRSAKPRTKLFIQLIPPGFTEDEFKELIRPFYDQIDYFVFRPGRIIRDSYGHLIGLDCPNYGFATINFKNPKFCPKFFREFNQMTLSDVYNVKSKLLVEFALLQEVPDFSISASTEILPNTSASFRDLPIYKEFLKTYPFAAKAEEERKSSLGPIKIDLEEDNGFSDIASMRDLGIDSSGKLNELDTKLSVPVSPIEKPVTFSTLVGPLMKNSTEAVTPLTEYVKQKGLNEVLKKSTKTNNTEGKKSRKRRGKGSKGKKDSEKSENKDKSADASSESKKDKQTKKRERKQRARERKKKELESAQQKQQQQIELEKKSFKTSASTAATSSEIKNNEAKKKKDKKESLVENAPHAAQIKGVPKILARRPASETPSIYVNTSASADACELVKKLFDGLLLKEKDKVVEEVTTNNKQRNRNRKSKDVKEKEEEPKAKPAREPYIRPEDRVKEPESSSPPNPANTISEPVKKVVVKSKQKNKSEPKKDDQSPVAAVPAAPVKRVFISSSKKREMDQNSSNNQ